MPLPTPQAGAVVIWDSTSGGSITSNGYSGTVVVPNLSVPMLMDSLGFQGTSGQVWTSTVGGTQWKTLASGPQGPQGTQGSTGSTGGTGGTGPQGPQGTQGVQGAIGSTGGAGPQGNQGTQGTAGTNGSNGSQGPQGTQGATGAQNAQGFTAPQGPPVYAVQGTQFSCTAQTATSVQGCQVSNLAANATYKFEVLLGVQGVGIQGYQLGVQCTQGGASQGGVILAKVSGGPQGTVVIGSGHQSYMATGFGIQGPQMCGAVGNTWIAAEGIFTTNSVAGSVFGVQVKGTQATVTPAILANSYLRVERLA